MCLKEFCDRYEAKIIKHPETNEEILYLSIRRSQYADVPNAVRLIPHLTSARANPKAKDHWLYCRHLSLWLIPCGVLNELLPDPQLEEKEMQNYWIDKFYNFYDQNDTLIPLWAKRQYWSYHIEDTLSDDDNDDIGVDAQNLDIHQGEQEVTTGNSDTD